MQLSKKQSTPGKRGGEGGSPDSGQPELMMLL